MEQEPEAVDIDGQRKNEGISFVKNSMKQGLKSAAKVLSLGTSEETFLVGLEGLCLWVLRDELRLQREGGWSSHPLESEFYCVGNCESLKVFAKSNTNKMSVFRWMLGWVYSICSPSVVPGLVVSRAPRNLLEILILEICPRPTESEILRGEGQKSGV